MIYLHGHQTLVSLSG